MHWYIVHTKPRQEKCAMENLHRQGYQCYLPILRSEKISRNQLQVVDEPLFPRYLFVQLGEFGAATGLVPVRSTKGVSRLVSFGVEPAKIDGATVNSLKAREASQLIEPVRMFNQGDKVRLIDAPWAGIEGVFQMADGERRGMVLIELLSKQVAVRVRPEELRKIG